MSDPEKSYTFYDWPYQAAAGAKPYCKTQTSLWYLPAKTSGTFELQNWGWAASVKHRKAHQLKNSSIKVAQSSAEGDSSTDGHDPTSTCGHFLSTFKLHLANEGAASGPQSVPPSMSETRPEGLSTERVISDYLEELSLFIMVELKNKFGDHIVKKNVQWCLTVPAIWSDTAKQTMHKCAQMSSLVQGRHCKDKDASPHPLVIVLEPEAASGGTVDLVVHEKVDDSGVKVKEVACSSGDLCGGTFVDKAFTKFLFDKIDCFEMLCAAYPATLLTITGQWENLKCSYDGETDDYPLELPAKLVSAWETHVKTSGICSTNSETYDEILITSEDMKLIFDREVNKILKLIRDQVALTPDLEAIMVVGGFSNSPYLKKRIRDAFSMTVKQIVSPTDPGSAVCQGAVAFGALGADIMMSRKSRKTYGIHAYREFEKGDPLSFRFLSKNGEEWCENDFSVFVQIGDDIPVNHAVSQEFEAVEEDQVGLDFVIYSTSDPEPKFVTDVGVVEEGSFSYVFPLEAQKLRVKLELEVIMHFGRTLIEVVGKPINFEGEETSMLSVVFERDLF
ncbi:unnamed protein product [Calypogeia fissa]